MTMNRAFFLAFFISFAFSFQFDSLEKSLILPNPDKTITVPIRNKHDTGYFLVLRVGSIQGNELFEMKLDITSPWIWVPEENCINCFQTNLYSSYYDCLENNATCYPLQNETLIYPTGSIKVFSGYDLVSFQGLPQNGTINHTLAFGMKVAHSFYEMFADGFFGLGLLSNKEMGFEHLIDRMLDQGWISKKQFALFLTDNHRNDAKSDITFGGFNPDRIPANQTLQISPNANPNFWSLKLKSFKLNHEVDVGITPREVILSTLYPEIGVPEVEFEKIIHGFKKAGLTCTNSSFFSNYVCECANHKLSQFPTLEFEVENATMKLPYQAYVSILGRSIRDDQGNLIYERHKNCVIGFRNVGEKEFDTKFRNTWIFGMSVMRYFYTVFDMEKMTIGFVEAKGSKIPDDLNFTPAGWVAVLVTLFLVVAFPWVIYKWIRVSQKMKNGVFSAGTRYTPL